MFGLIYLVVLIVCYIVYLFKKQSFNNRSKSKTLEAGRLRTYTDYNGKSRSVLNNNIAREGRDENGDKVVYDVELHTIIENLSEEERERKRKNAKPGTVAILYNDYYHDEYGDVGLGVGYKIRERKNQIKGYRYYRLGNYFLYGLVNYMGHNIYIDLDTYKGVCISDGDRARTEEAYSKGKRYYKDGLTPELVVQKYNEFLEKYKKDWEDYEGMVRDRINEMVCFDKDDKPLSQWEIKRMEDL